MIWFSKCWLLKGQTLNFRVCPFLLLLKQPLAQPVDKELIAMDKKLPNRVKEKVCQPNQNYRGGLRMKDINS